MCVSSYERGDCPPKDTQARFAPNSQPCGRSVLLGQLLRNRTQIRRFRDPTEGFEGSNPPLSASHIWTPPACKGDCRRDLELGCSHISGLLVGRQMKPRP